MNRIEQYNNEIRELIAKDDLSSAIEKLKPLFKNNSTRFNEVLLQSGRYNDLKSKIREGTISFQDGNIEKSKIRRAILELVDEIEVKSKEDEDFAKEIIIIIREESSSDNKLILWLTLTLVIAFSTIIFGILIYGNSTNINIENTEGSDTNVITGNNNKVHNESVIIYQNPEEARIRRNIHDLSLYYTHYLNSLLDSSNPQYFELKVGQIDNIKNELEKRLEFVGIKDKIKIPTDTLNSRHLLLEMVEFEKKEVKSKIQINLGESYYYTYILSRNMWQYEYFFNIFQKTGDIDTQEALVMLRNNITDFSKKVDFTIDERKLSSFLYDPNTELLDEIILGKKLHQ